MATTVLALFSFGIMARTHANEFLKAPKVHNEHIREQDIRMSLLDAIEDTLGAGSASGRLAQMEALLGPIVASLPKNKHGNLAHSAVRYALHRLFVLRHGWAIKGLGPAALMNRAPSLDGILKDQVPSYTQSLLEHRLAGKGFGLHEVAILGATIEHLIHSEAVSRLGAAFNALSLPLTDVLSDAEAAEVLDTYMMAYILGEDISTANATEVRESNAEMSEVFLPWHDTQEFVQQVQHRVIKKEDLLNFATLAKVVETVGEEFGTFQDTECHQLKERLLKMEYRGTGRVLLSDFYQPAHNGSWQFQESIGYLRELGLLDESDAKQPSVMVANYINSQSNCVASAGFYSVCCKNECESLLGYLEQKINASDAEPATIAGLVWKLPSSTVAAPRDVSPKLFQRLSDIAAIHGGRVPLHSRLFAQWMHHAYPRECSYPHLSGTTSALSPEEWMDESGKDPTASTEEIQQYLALSGNATGTHAQTESTLAVDELIPWSSDEELFVVRHTLNSQMFWNRAGTPASVRSMVLIAAAGSLAFAVVQGLKMSSLEDAVPSKFLV